MRHKASGKYLTTVGLVTLLSLGDNGTIAGYKSEAAAKTSLNSILKQTGIVWDELEVSHE